ncbi:MAG: YHS domain-containing protein [Phycisphaerae bacterium]|nr:YHS domain-containing protein [Phycisphaerae bacterium]
MMDEKVDPSITTTYRGQTIAFCCERCLQKFNANPERYAARLAVFAQNDNGRQSSSDPGSYRREDASPARDHEEERVDANAESASSTGTPASDGAEHEENNSRVDEGAHETHAHGERAVQGAPGARTEQSDGDADESQLNGFDADHEHDHDDRATGVMAALAWLGRFHPPAVNFPIAMLVGAAVAEGLWMATKRQLFVSAGRFCLWFGGLTAILAGTLGWFFGGFHLADESWIMTTHRWLGTGTALWALSTLIVGERAYRDATAARRKAYRIMLFVGAAAVLTAGFFGGAMIYGINHYAW